MTAKEHPTQEASGLLRDLLDAMHELRIRLAMHRMLRHDRGRTKACADFTRLINTRSAAQVARMEAGRGI